MNLPNIRDRIVTRRRERIRTEGHTLGVAVPQTRQHPLVPFLRAPGLICEIKRRSPSRGAIDEALDPVELAGRYAAAGVRSVSVLTEEDHFAGSLRDLMEVKRAHPQLSILRKDFLVDREDIDVSLKAGADAVLLIASMLSGEELSDLHQYARAQGLAVLVELHEHRDFAKAREFAPALAGINARDLTTFRTDLLTPLRLREEIDWSHRAVFESGAFHEEDGRLVARAGFDGLLVGEAAVRDQQVIPQLLRGLKAGRADSPVGDAPGTDCPPNFFWSTIARRVGASRRPLVKICGITNREDAELAVGLGADLLGLVFAESPRRATTALARALADLSVLKVAVVVSGGKHGPLPHEVSELLEQGLIDAVQFHGDEQPQECARWAFPYYKAVRIGATADVAAMQQWYSPRVLVDARSSTAYGGTGKRLEPEVVRAVAEKQPLWLAGGLNDENIADVMRQFSPELVDVSSGLEAAPGQKDAGRMHRFFEEIERLSHG